MLHNAEQPWRFPGMSWNLLPFLALRFSAFHATIIALYFSAFEGDSCEKMAVIDCSKEQYYATYGDGPWRFFWMHFSGCAADSFVRMVNGGALRTADSDPARAAELFDQLDSMAHTPGRQTDLLLSLWIHQLLCELARTVECGPVSRHQAAMEEAASFLHAHLGEPIRVGDLAQKAGMSEFYFQRVFHEVMGQSPYDYLTRLRVERAKLLLLSSDHSVAEIAAMVGYSDARGLINSFKKREGCTPSCLRRKKAGERILP
ncbi:hypothetical protein B5F35_17035 [Anaeromassilibacillus sp. An200]|nr:hypothetical protein B5F35_17035 [Anaeromassilibacillus sp. An200]